MGPPEGVERWLKKICLVVASVVEAPRYVLKLIFSGRAKLNTFWSLFKKMMKNFLFPKNLLTVESDGNSVSLSSYNHQIRVIKARSCC